MTDLVLSTRTTTMGASNRAHVYRRPFVVLEDSSGYLILEDGTGYVLQESDPVGVSLMLSTRSTGIILQ